MIALPLICNWWLAVDKNRRSFSDSSLTYETWAVQRAELDQTQHFQISHKEGVDYVSVVLDTLKHLKTLKPPSSSSSSSSSPSSISSSSSSSSSSSNSLVDSLKLTTSSQQRDTVSTDSGQKLHWDNIKMITEEQRSLAKSKAAIEKKINDLEGKKMEEEEAIKEREMVTKLDSDVRDGKRRDWLFVIHAYETIILTNHQTPLKIPISSDRVLPFLEFLDFIFSPLAALLEE